jgi:glutamine synthetase
LKLVEDKEVKFVDFRFTDTRGKEQHVTVPVRRPSRTWASCTAAASRTPTATSGKTSG